MAAAFIRFLAWIERTLRLVGFLFRLLLIAAVVALLSRISGLVQGDLISVFWIAVGVGLFTVAMPSFVYGYESRVDDQYADDLAAAKAKRDRGLK